MPLHALSDRCHCMHCLTDAAACIVQQMPLHALSHRCRCSDERGADLSHDLGQLRLVRRQRQAVVRLPKPDCSQILQNILKQLQHTKRYSNNSSKLYIHQIPCQTPVSRSVLCSWYMCRIHLTFVHQTASAPRQLLTASVLAPCSKGCCTHA